VAKKKIKNKKNFKFPKDKIIDFFKKLSLKNYLNIVVVLLLIISSTYIFFQYKMIIFPDSIGYYHNAYIIMGIKNLSEWLTVRGFGFPLIITFWIKLFGDTSLGMLIGSYTAYLTMIIIIGYLIQKYIKLNEINNKLLYFFLYIIIIVFNPLIIGYNHTLLTEAVMPAIYFAEVLLCLKWYESTLRQNKKSIIILNIIFILLGILIWFIKQPFIVAYIVGLLITAICSAIKNKSWKILAQKLLTILICLVTLFICLKIWNSFISNNISTQNSPSDLNNKYLNNKFISGLNVFYYGVSKDTFCNTNYIEKADFSNKEKEKIYLLIEEESENWCSYIKVFEIKELNGAHVATEILYSNNGNFNLESRLSFLVKNVIKHPTYVLRSYLYNYLAIADIQTTDCDPLTQKNCPCNVSELGKTRYWLKESAKEDDKFFTCNQTSVIADNFDEQDRIGVVCKRKNN